MQQKDYFSGHSSLYATFRPTYPKELYDFIFSKLKDNSAAWDCATGNGQVANDLSSHFKLIIATDISQNQLDKAIQKDNIQYLVSPAEKTPFNERQFDLITVGQAMHWFNIDEFFQEVRRVGKKGSLLAVWGYAICKVNEDIDKLFNHFYHNVVGQYWDEARRHVEQEYTTLPFPFEQIPTPAFQLNVNWTFDEFVGYLSTWSATQKYIKATSENPLPFFEEDLRKVWPVSTEKKTVTFPMFLKLGIIQ